MTERLTKRDGNGRVALLVDGYYTRIKDATLLKVASKLAYYEDLEEQGRIIRAEDGVFPELQRLKFYKANDRRTIEMAGMDMAEASIRFTVYQKQIDEGRLVVMPEKLMQMLISKHCPEEFGLKSKAIVCPKRKERECRECWVQALKGGNHEKPEL